MPTVVKPFRMLFFALALVAVGCHAQTPPAGRVLTLDMARRVEVLIRSRTRVPPDYQVEIGPRTKSEVPGYDAIAVIFSADGKSSKPLMFLLSNDGKTLAQMSKFDISQDPKTLVSGQTGQPGGDQRTPPC